MKKRTRRLAILLAALLLMLLAAQTAAGAMLDMSGFNDDLVTVSKVPRGKAGSKISIKMTIHNTGTKGDNELEELRLANSYEYERIMEREFGESDEEDGSDLRPYAESFPFEADSSTFQAKKINIKPGSSKSVTVSYKLRRDLKEGYYQAFFILDGSIEIGVNFWVSPYDGSTERDETDSLDSEFSLGESPFF